MEGFSIEGVEGVFRGGSDIRGGGFWVGSRGVVGEASWRRFFSRVGFGRVGFLVCRRLFGVEEG